MNNQKNKVVGIIPARFDSTRFPGKAIADIAGKPMIQWVYEGSISCPDIDEVYIATDDNRIVMAAMNFTNNIVMTSEEHRSGTDRIAEAAKEIDADIIVNIQGDEPLIEAAALSALVEPFSYDASVRMTTLATYTNDPEEIVSPHTCKLVLDKNSDGVYFSRAPIPYFRERPEPYLRHIGLYAFRREFLFEFASIEPGPLEIAESLEMLRAIENGFPIRVAIGAFTSIGVDTPEDKEIVEKILKNSQQK